MNKLFNKKIYLLILIFGAVLLPHSVFASIVYIDTNHSEFFVGDTILFSVRVNSENKDINTVEGEVLLNNATNTVSLTGINTGGSQFSLWPTKPIPSENNTNISFVGGSPGGFISKDAIVFNIVLKLQEIGEITLSPNNIGVYLNDGKGTKDAVSVKNLIINVLPKKSDAQSTDDWNTVLSNDKKAPESFEITMGKDPSIFDNRYFISFFTTDAESGVAYYEVKEGERDFARTESPYLLQDQSLQNSIKIKAIDKAGNERLATLQPLRKQTNYQNLLFWSIIIIALVFLYLGGKLVWRKKIRS